MRKEIRVMIEQANIMEVDSMVMNLEVALDRFEESAVQRGKQEGERKGEKRGEQKGEQKGEKKKALEIAKNLIGLGLPVEQIVMATGLTVDEIKKIMN